MHDKTLPRSQFALQLVGPEKLKLNPRKPVQLPGPHQILCKIEATGLCFSDLKLLKQFSAHARKGKIISGLSEDMLASIPSYVPEDQPTVPGHESVCRIVDVGDKVQRHRVGERCLVQTDYRALKTQGSNAAFGYNFEGALQEYVLLDERVVVDPESNERFLIPVEEELSSSSVCLVEPWACVEDSYVTEERQSIKADGRLAVVADAGRDIIGLEESFSSEGKPATLYAICADEAQIEKIKAISSDISIHGAIDDLEDESLDDIVYFGANQTTIEKLNDKLGVCGIINIVLGGKTIGSPVSVGVGRVHYGMTRWIGATGFDAAKSYQSIPPNGEIRDNDSILVIGAGGPMGQMHMIRNICCGRKNIAVTGSDVDDERLESLRQKAQPFAEANGVTLELVNTRKTALIPDFDYIALMAPVGALVASSIQDANENAIINIFAGIPAPTKHEIDLDAYIAKRLFMFGTSGSTINDMKIVLDKVTRGALDTNCSVDAICGMAGAAEGIAAVDNRTLAGKIIVYPMLHNIGLIPLENLKEHFPTVAAKLDNGQWCKAAEDELLKVALE